MRPRPPREGQDFPWWLVVLGLAAAYAGWQIWASPLHAQILSMLVRGIGVTLAVSAGAFAGASILGLALALAGLSRHLVLRQAARLYIEVMRGLPIIVLLLYVAFVLVPGGIWALNRVLEPLGAAPLLTRDVPLIWRAGAALVLAYAAYLAELFRAGIQSVDQGQVEAAQALGLTGWQRFRLIVLPQALRIILPALGNELIAMIKDSSLVSVLGVTDVTQLGKVVAAGNFRYFETYNLVAGIYLTLTVGLSLILRRIEVWMRLRGPDRRTGRGSRRRGNRS